MKTQPVTLSDSEKIRYSRHLSLPSFTMKEQLALKSAKVLVVGCGGLGAPIILYLAAAGIGNLGLVDGDKVELSNLQRQVIFSEKDIGKPKCDVAVQVISKMNEEVRSTCYNYRITSKNAMDIISQYDIVIDGSDNFPTRYLLNDACVLLGKTLVYGSIYRYEGQVSVFNQLRADHTRGPNYRDLFPLPPAPGLITNCVDGGVLGMLPGLIGSIMAGEVVKILTKIGSTLDGKIMLVDMNSNEFRKIKIRLNPDNPLSGNEPEITALIDYQVFCGVKEEDIRSIDFQELNAWKINEIAFLLIDVREEEEYKQKNLGGIPIPLSILEENHHQIPKSGRVIIHCQSGLRSIEALTILNNQYGYTNLYNLAGGMNAVDG